jgi:hypothetical protein
VSADRTTSVTFEFPTLSATLRASLLWDFNPMMCELLLENLPTRTMYSHTMSSGAGMYAPMRVVGSVQARRRLLSEIPIGTVTLNIENYKTMSLFYGRVTEPLPTTPVAQVVDADLDTLRAVGRGVWYANYCTHSPVLAVVSAACS